MSTSLTRAARSPERTSLISPGGSPTPWTPEFSFTSPGTIPYTYRPVCCPVSGLDFSRVDAGMSVLLPAAAAGALPFPAVVAVLFELVGGGIEHAPGLVLGAALLHSADESRQALLLLADVQAVDGLGETQIRVDARDDDARVDGEYLDSHQRHTHVGVDHPPLVEDRLDNVG